jgi:hypothetical protein
MLDFRLRGLPLLWVAVLVKIASQVSPGWAEPVVQAHGGLIPVLATWMLGVAFTVVNLRALSPGARSALGAFTVGFTLNSLAIGLNGGAMPFAARAAQRAGVPADLITTPTAGHIPIAHQTRVDFLADVIPLPGLGAVVSAGDLLMAAGISILIINVVWHGAQRFRPSPQPTATAIRGTAGTDGIPL